jgi:tRNA and rRNA cytosine-C5-methylases
MPKIHIKNIALDIPEGLDMDERELDAAHNQPAVVSVRTNLTKPITQFISEKKIPWCENGYYLSENKSFVSDPLWHAGNYYVQEASSMFLSETIRQLQFPQEQVICLDLCAAPGGKTTLLCDSLPKNSLIISNEIVPNRAGILRENAIKWGNPNCWVLQNSPSKYGTLKNYFNLLVIDAPCSGSGLFRKMPDYINEWKQDTVEQCVARQKEILFQALDCLCEDGILIYMTCSFSKEENEDMIDYILDHHNMESVSLSIKDEWKIMTSYSEKSKSACYRFFPHLLQGEGFFLSVLRKKSGELQTVPSARVLPNQWADELKSFVEKDDFLYLIHNEQIVAVAPQLLGYFQLFAKSFKYRRLGFTIGKIIHKQLLPSHELAMYPKCIYAEKVDVNLTEAINYLQKNPLSSEHVHKGWKLITYENQALGWSKWIQYRMNNYYPTEFRILDKNSLSYK